MVLFRLFKGEIPREWIIHFQRQGKVETTWQRIKAYIFSAANLRACSI